MGPDGTGKNYYYGDSVGPLGNGKVMSTASALHYTDEKFYLENGQMVPIVPVDPNGIKNVVVTPESAAVNKGNTLTFTATVYKNNGTTDAAGVNWTVNSTITSINSAGVLSVAASESATELTVTATSKTNTAIKATAAVYVSGSGSGTGEPTVADGGRILDYSKTGDSSSWLEIARWGGYSLILRMNPIDSCCFNKVASNNRYADSGLRDYLNFWFNNANNPGPNLPQNARIRDFTVSNNALSKLGSATTANGMANGLSTPTGDKYRFGIDIAFALSHAEAAFFCSKQWSGVGTGWVASTPAAQANFNRLGFGNETNIWLRTPYEPRGYNDPACGVLRGIGGTVTFFSLQYWYTGPCGPYWVFYRNQASPALWVDSAIFNV